LKTLVIKENQKLREISYTTKLNQNQSAICAPLYKRWWFSIESKIKAKNHESEDHKSILAQEEI